MWLHPCSCIPDTWLCDTYDDCPTGEDEDAGMCGSMGCEADEFECNDGSCIPDSWVCDFAYEDCPDGEDEAGCV